MEQNEKKTFLIKLKTNWKTIVTVLLTLFSLNKCTQSCSRQTKLDKANSEIQIKDSTINALVADTLAKAHKIDMLEEKLNTANEKVNVAKAQEETAKANEETANANALKAKAEAEKEKLRRQLNTK